MPLPWVTASVVMAFHDCKYMVLDVSEETSAAFEVQAATKVIARRLRNALGWPDNMLDAQFGLSPFYCRPECVVNKATVIFNRP